MINDARLDEIEEQASDLFTEIMRGSRFKAMKTIEEQLHFLVMLMVGMQGYIDDEKDD